MESIEPILIFLMNCMNELGGGFFVLLLLFLLFLTGKTYENPAMQPHIAQLYLTIKLQETVFGCSYRINDAVILRMLFSTKSNFLESNVFVFNVFTRGSHINGPFLLYAALQKFTSCDAKSNSCFSNMADPKETQLAVSY